MPIIHTGRVMQAEEVVWMCQFQGVKVTKLQLFWRVDTEGNRKVAFPNKMTLTSCRSEMWQKSTATYKYNKTGECIGRWMHLIPSTQGKIIRISKIVDLNVFLLFTYCLFGFPLVVILATGALSGVHLAGRAVAIVSCGSCLFAAKSIRRGKLYWRRFAFGGAVFYDATQLIW